MTYPAVLVRPGQLSLIYVADTGGNGARQVNPAGSAGMFPFWSRDGKAVGYTRMAADQHYLTDVLVGAAVGAGIGVGMPLWLHGREDRQPGERASSVKVLPLPLGVLVRF